MSLTMTPRRQPRLSFASSDDDDNNSNATTKDTIDIIGLDDGDSESVQDDASDSDNLHLYGHRGHHRPPSLLHHPRGLPDEGGYSSGFPHQGCRAEGLRDDLLHSPSLGT